MRFRTRFSSPKFHANAVLGYTVSLKFMNLGGFKGYARQPIRILKHLWLKILEDQFSDKFVNNNLS
jgi:hypothetical protein